MVIPWVVHMYVEIIHELKRVDYLAYMWTTHGTTCISVDLAHYKIFHAKVGIKNLTLLFLFANKMFVIWVGIS